MAIRMPSPVLFANGVWHLNIRVPKDLAAKLRGTTVTLPVAGKTLATRVGDKVVLSLRTRDPKEAKARFKSAEDALEAHFAFSRTASMPHRPHVARAVPPGSTITPSPTAAAVLSHKAAVALSGEFYRAFVESREQAIGPDDFVASRATFEDDVHAWSVGDGAEGDEPLAKADAEFLATLALPDGLALLAWTRGGVDDGCLKMTEEEGLEILFGREADQITARHRLSLDPASRVALMRQFGQSMLLATGRLKRAAEGDFSPDPNLPRFPDFRGLAKVTVADVFDHWRTHNADKVAKSTIRRYTPTLNSLAGFLAGKDIRKVEEDDIWVWAEHRRDHDGIAARTVNRNDLVAASSVFAMTRDGQRLLKENPAKGVKLDTPKERKLRERTFRTAEITAILTLARQVRTSRSYPRAAASRRWIPWMCAYLGCRVQEPCWLRKDSFRKEGGVWVVEFAQTKDGNARVVPLHDTLIDEGLIDFVLTAPDNWLFVADKPRVKESDKTIQEQRASEISAWIKQKVGLDAGVDPSHGWRHTWISIASSLDVNINKRHQNAINGHNKNKDASDGYCEFPIRELKAAMDLFPRFTI